MHLVELRLELQPQLHFFFVVLCILHVLFLESEPQSALIRPIMLEFLVASLQHAYVLLQQVFIVEELLALGLKVFMELLNLPFMLLVDLLYHHLIIVYAAVFQ